MQPPLPFTPLSRNAQLRFILLAVATFHVAYEVPACAPLLVIFLWSLFRLAHVATRPEAMYGGWIVGLCIYGPQLGFFWTIFGPGAIGLWLILSCWVSLYLMLQRFALRKLGPDWGALAAPFLWMGLEYFRSELYPLKFSWLNMGYAFAPLGDLFKLSHLGMYGIGFLLMLLATQLRRGIEPGKRWVVLVIALSLIMMAPFPSDRRSERSLPPVNVAGIQFEFESEPNILEALDKLVRQQPSVQLIVLSEYSFQGPIPRSVQQWCAQNRRYLIAGGKQFLDATEQQYYNTAFIIGPDGKEVFQQAKAMPIQFFKDGLPAPRQKVWESPWGKVGVCVCYDLSYTRVTDELIRQGASALIVPTMDVQDWGERQHRLHARVAPTRAAEYGVPVFRLCSSGISQAIQSSGRVESTAPYPGQGKTLSMTLELGSEGGTLPWDRWLVWAGVFLAAVLLGWHIVDSLQARANFKFRISNSKF